MHVDPSSLDLDLESMRSHSLTDKPTITGDQQQPTMAAPAAGAGAPAAAAAAVAAPLPRRRGDLSALWGDERLADVVIRIKRAPAVDAAAPAAATAAAAVDTGAAPAAKRVMEQLRRRLGRRRRKRIKVDSLSEAADIGAAPTGSRRRQRRLLILAVGACCFLLGVRTAVQQSTLTVAHHVWRFNQRIYI
jgi:hypothetical protein